MLITVLWSIINFPAAYSWAGAGIALRRLLTKPSYVRAFNIVMALLLVLSLYPLFM